MSRTPVAPRMRHVVIPVRDVATPVARYSRRLGVELGDTSHGAAVSGMPTTAETNRG